VLWVATEAPLLKGSTKFPKFSMCTRHHASSPVGDHAGDVRRKPAPSPEWATVLSPAGQTSNLAKWD